MTRKFFIAAGHGGGDPGSIYHGMQEHEANIMVTDRIFELLKGQNHNGVEFIKVPHELNLQGTINWINARSSGINDWCIEIHFDVSTNQKLRGSLIISGNNDLGKSLGQPIIDAFNATGVKSRGFMWNESKKFTNSAGQVIQVGFGFINFTKPLANIVECDFLTNAAVVDGLRNKGDANIYAKAITSAILKVVGSSYKEPQLPTHPAPTPSPVDDLYRVTFRGEQLGAYKNNPITRINELESKLTEASKTLVKRDEQIAHLTEQVRLKDGEVTRIQGVLIDTQKSLQTTQDALKQCRLDKGDSISIGKLLDALRKFLKRFKEVKVDDKIHE